GPMEYELLVPAVDVESLRSQIEGEITFHTLFFMQGDGKFFEPTLIGFRQASDKLFFEKFVTVKGIGPRTALRALTVPMSDIAGAIEEKDARYLTGLKGIGKRTAELIVAELSGKLGAFVFAGLPGDESAPKRPSKLSAVDEDAMQALVALGERRHDAEELLAKAKAAKPDAKTTDALVREMLRLRTQRA
ncbi:MAG TPA: Holliday junction branch migration protein RuvA, partial [Tepidisphaeraceae bacterium]